jgi:Domain of unknown function (DUF4116)
MSDLRARLNKILDLHGQSLAEAVGQREPTSCEAQLQLKESCRSNRDLILRFAGSDPTPGKSRTQWLVKTYIADERFKLEDLGRVDAALAAFERFKHKLPVEQREISHLKTLSALEALVDPFIRAEAKARLERDLSTATGREKRRLEEWKARDESIILQEKDGLPTIAVPMTEFASKWWGRGTRWCTAAEKDNMFSEYHKDAPLLIIVCPDGEKFQMYVKTTSHLTFQFMDNADTAVNKNTIRDRWNEFQSLFNLVIQQDGRILQYVPEKYKSLELCSLAIEQNGRILQFVSKNDRTPDLCRLAVEQNGLALESVPEEHRTPELCRIAIEQNGYALQCIPEDKRTPELCRLAVQRDGRVLQYVPKDKKTPELCRLAVEQDGRALYDVPGDKRTPELFRLAVEQNGRALEYVPVNKRTLDLCRIAVEQNGQALQDVPDDLKSNETIDLCRIAVEQDAYALQFVPATKRTPELCRLSVQKKGCVLVDVPENLRTTELCRLAIEQNGRALQSIPKERRSLELCRISVEQNGEALQFVPEEHRSLELCRIAVEQNILALQNVSLEYRNSKYMTFIPPAQLQWSTKILNRLYCHSQSMGDVCNV